MVDAVDTLVIQNNALYYQARFTNICDGSGESAVVKIDKSALTDANGQEPDALDIEEIQWDIQGFTEVRLLWDHTTDDEIVILSPGQGCRKYGPDRLRDPKSAGGAGDVVLTTTGNTAADTYDITVLARKRQAKQ